VGGTRRSHGEGGVYQRASDSKWVAALDLGWVNGKRKRKVLYGTTRRQVLDKLNAARHELECGTLATGPAQTVADYLTGWLADIKAGVRPRTYESYELNVRRLVPHLGRLRLSSLRPQHIQRVYTALQTTPGMRGKPLDARSVEQVHTVLHTALERAVKWDLIGRNPAEAVVAPRPVKHERRTLTSEQAAILFDASGAANDRFVALWWLFATTGPRMGEATGLQWSDVDLERGVVVVKRALQRQKGVGLIFVEPKSASSRRAVRLPRVTAAALKDHRKRQLEERLTAGPKWRAHDLIFCTTIGTPLDPARLRKAFHRALKRAELPDMRPHDLRHTTATLLGARGIHPKQVQELLGHSSITLTLGTYSHVFDTMHKAAAEEMDALFGHGGHQEQDKRPSES
jgi:integrase